jgi:hypothetical protein
MHAVIAALGWVLAAYLFVQLVRAARMLLRSRAMLEHMLRKHEPHLYTRYVATLADSGMKPVPHTKES